MLLFAAAFTLFNINVSAQEQSRTKEGAAPNKELKAKSPTVINLSAVKKDVPANHNQLNSAEGSKTNTSTAVKGTKTVSQKAIERRLPKKYDDSKTNLKSKN